MIDSMLLWMMILPFLYSSFSFHLLVLFGLSKPGGILGVLGLKMCETRVWGGFRGIGGFGGCKPWFYTFWGFWGVF
jgi:hypothetical protein